MNIDINTSLEKLLEAWVMYSYKFYHTQKITKEELENFKKINEELDRREIIRVEVYNIEEKKYTLRYFNHECEFKKKFIIED